MNIFRAIGRAFVGIGKGILAALRFAEQRGLTDLLVDIALHYVAKAQVDFQTNEERAEWVVQQLRTNQHVPENIARGALFLAVELYKKKIGG